MKTVMHPANSRGHANHGWLDSYHTFSFAQYHNPSRTNFGALRVLNDDRVAPGAGFGTHPHNNMEIVSIPLEGTLEHKDSMGNLSVIRKGDVQVLSSGTGITHSEYNKSENEEVKFLQIWMIPDTQNVAPRYDQISLREVEKHNELYQILSPNRGDEGVWVHQNAWFHIGKLSSGWRGKYTLKGNNHGVYVFILSGTIRIDNTELAVRDGFGIWDTPEFELCANTDCQVLLMEVPMNNFS